MRIIVLVIGLLTIPFTAAFSESAVEKQSLQTLDRLSTIMDALPDTDIRKLTYSPITILVSSFGILAMYKPEKSPEIKSLLDELDQHISDSDLSDSEAEDWINKASAFTDTLE